MGKTNSRNPFFNNFGSFQEQRLMEDLILEMHSIHAPQMYYMPRIFQNLDQLYTADDEAHYTKAFLVPIFVENFDRFNGDGNFMSKFNLEIRNQIQLSIARRTFTEEIGNLLEQVRPNEGDLIYFPLNKHCFQIKYVEKFEMFYPLGKLYTWQLTCELFEYSNEQIATGIPEIDSLMDLSIDILDYNILTEDGYLLADEVGDYIVQEQYDIQVILGTGANEDIQREGGTFIDFSVEDPFSEGKMVDY
jgi:hypothetical protein